MSKRHSFIPTICGIFLACSLGSCSQQKTDEVLMTKVEKTFLVLEHPQPCMLRVSVLNHEETPLQRGVAHTLELEVLETTPCVDEGDIIKFYASGNIGETFWRDNPKYCEHITRVNNTAKKKVPPGMLYFDIDAAKAGAVWASETAQNNLQLKAEIERQEKAGNYGADIVWDKFLKQGGSKKGSE